ncbi:uncharacterized protein [Lolium perenne]|uniref:uncharacterized protein n=1 Tax=Lolium perenne TaxID=4522 RepID=UPI0021EAFD4C|nr:probable WRKY transcription factor 65 [Lolium perenne]
MSAEDGYCSTGTESPRADSADDHPPADADSPVTGAQSKRDHPSPSSPLPPPKRSRRSVEKRVVSVPISECGERARINGEGPPPPDSWAWRKYGQKPIKGSPYPRGYYRCSSSKGCPARKQVERCRTDPTVLLVTYSYDHNHPWPAPKGGAGGHPTKSSPRLTEPKPEPKHEPGTPADYSEPEPTEQETPEPVAPKQEQLDQEEEQEQKPDIVSLAESSAGAITSVTPAAAEDEEESFEFGWFDQYHPTWHRATALYVPAFDTAPPLLPPEEWERELQGEDTLFAGLGELPDCAIVFGRRPEIALAATAPCS